MCYASVESPTVAQYENILTVLLAFSTLHCNNLNCSHILLAVKHVTVLMVCCSFGIMVTECNHTQLDYLLITNHLITAHYFSLLYLLWSLHSCVSVKENMQCTWVLCMYIYYLKHTCNCGWVYNSVCVYMCARVRVCVMTTTCTKKSGWQDPLQIGWPSISPA